MGTNAATLFYDTAIVSARIAEAPSADFLGGANRGASNACGIGINTGNYAPKAQDWTPTGGTPYLAESGYIGIDSGANSAIQAIDPLDQIGKNVAFIQSVAPVAPLGVIGQISGNDLINHTGETIPSGVDTWGIRSTA